MNPTKPEELKYSYCWHCINYTALCPHCSGNACACACTASLTGEYAGLSHDEMPCMLSKFWDAVKQAEDNDMVPTVVTEEEINGRLERLRTYYAEMAPEKRKKNQGFGIGLLDESEYWKIQNKAKLINMTIPSLEDFGKEVDVEPNYDCSTGCEFTKETDISIVNPLGWDSQDSYENERIPWFEYCERRQKSDCDYTKFITKRRKILESKNRNLTKELIKDFEPGENILVLSGSYSYKTGVMIDNTGESVKVKLDEDGQNVMIYKNNSAELKKEKDNVGV